MKNDNDSSLKRIPGAQSAREIGSIKFTVMRHEYSPLYAIDDPISIGQALDKAIISFYADNATGLLTSLSFELGDEAAAALRDRCNRGEY